MVEVIQEIKPIARKKHVCMAFEFIEDNGVWIDGVTLSETKAIEKMRQNGGMIQVGEKYVRQTNKYDGRIYTWKANQEMHDICIKYDLYEA